MENPLENLSDLPKPVMVVALLASGASLATIVAAIRSDHPGWRIAAFGLILVALLLGLYKLVLMLKDKSKSSPFAAMITKGSVGRAGSDPAAKARMDDMRKKFEEGVSTFKQAGKDLYSLPWYLLVGPSGSGKTEAMRHCNVGFPQGLQDCLQGTGGTLNMHWWFTNHAVVLDTAGRMFMEEGGEGQSTEWKEFLKLLRSARPNCPVNGLLLVISAENLLKDTSEKIEKTAGAIARQLDLIQRTLEVRFPVTVLVTKCDKIVGFREFFETVSDPTLQHQIVGWSNPASLDEAFRPTDVETHLSGVRDKLMKRRAGLLKDPIHTMDPHARRTDEVDELFELPDNLMRIAPRLRRYLEMIFVAGEWSPKPLFLRGIYFTSSMREGQALDMNLAAALGVDVESLPASKEYDKEKAYFLRDVFLGKVFKERGLVTRAGNVRKHLAAQRAWILGGSIGAAAIVALATLASIMGYRESLGRPAAFWKPVWEKFSEGNTDATVAIFEPGANGVTVYKGGERLDGVPEVAKRVELVDATAKHTQDIRLGVVGAPAAAMMGDSSAKLSERQLGAHRAVVERTLLAPLMTGVRAKLKDEKRWGIEAQQALAQWGRLLVMGEGAQPRTSPAPTAVPSDVDSRTWELVDVAALAKYAMDRAEFDKLEASQLKMMQEGVKKAYPAGLPTDKDEREASVRALVGGDLGSSWEQFRAGASRMMEAARSTDSDSPKDSLAFYRGLGDELKAFDDAEHKEYSGKLAWVVTEKDEDRKDGWKSVVASGEGYSGLITAYSEKVKAIGDWKKKIDQRIGHKDFDKSKPVTGQFDAATAAAKAKIGSSLKLLREQMPEKAPTGQAQLAKTMEMLDESVEKSGAKLAMASIDDESKKIGEVLERYKLLLASGKRKDTNEALYAVRASVHEGAGAHANEEPKFDAPSLKLTQHADAIRKGLEGHVAEMAEARMWRPEGVESAQTGLDQTTRVGQRIEEAAAARKRQVLLLAALGEDCWKSAESLKEAVKSAAETSNADLTAPTVPLTQFDGRAKFNSQYWPVGARDLIEAWKQIDAMLGATDSSVVGVAEIKQQEGYKSGSGARIKYVDDYKAFWTEMASIASRPMAPKSDGKKTGWQMLIGNLDAVKIAAGLTAMRDRCDEAFKAVGAEATADFKGIGAMKEQLGDNCQNLATRWSRLEGPGKSAPEEIARLAKGGTLKAELFSLLRPSSDGLYVAYFNNFYAAAAMELRDEAQAEAKRAVEDLASANAVPLVASTNRQAADLPANVNWAEIIQKLSRISGLQASAGTTRVSLGEFEAFPTLRSDLEAVVNHDGISKERLDWASRMSAAAEFAGKKPVLKVGFADTWPSKAGVGNVATKLEYVQVWIDGVMAAEGRMIPPMKEEVAKALQFELGKGRRVELRFMKDDSSHGGKAEEKDRVTIGRISENTSPWGPMRDYLVNSLVQPEMAGGKATVVLPLDSDAARGVALTIEVENGQMLDWTKYQQASDWPK